MKCSISLSSNFIDFQKLIQILFFNGFSVNSNDFLFVSFPIDVSLFIFPSYYWSEPYYESVCFVPDFTSVVSSGINFKCGVCWFKINVYMLNEICFYFHYLKVFYKYWVFNLPTSFHLFMIGLPDFSYLAYWWNYYKF